MNGFPDLQSTAKLLADESRLGILTFLMDGRFHTVREIAQTIKVKDQTTSYHLKKLQENDWLMSYKQGRHVYYRLSNSEVAELLERLPHLSPLKEIKSYKQHKEFYQLKAARTCYAHLAGIIGVGFFDYLLEAKYMSLQQEQLTITESGWTFFQELGLDLAEIQRQPGIFAKPCLDWTERKFHLAGNLGKAFLKLCFEKKYLIRNSSNRSVAVTEAGTWLFPDL